MSKLLQAQFVRRFPGGGTITADWTQEADGFTITVLFGPSGCGKTTILRCLAGLDRPVEGTIRLGDEVWYDAPSKTHRSPQDRGVGYLSQDYALFPHLSVANNVGYGLSGPRGARRQQVGNLLARFQLGGLESRYPHQLSGGQQQRVALARALACRPRLLLLDEPLSALDGPTREELRRELRKLLADFGIPVVLVTHDRLEALSLADYVVVLDGGKTRQAGPTHLVFSKPTDLAVARIVGMETVQPGRIVACGDGLARVAVGTVELIAIASKECVGEVVVCIRAEEVTLQRSEAVASSARNHLPCRVVDVAPEGPLMRVNLDAGFPLAALITRPAGEELQLAAGMPIVAVLKAPAIHLVPRRAG